MCRIPAGSKWWNQTWGSMLNALDRGIGNLTAALRTENMFDDTLIVMTSDNGGDCHFGDPANNYPLVRRRLPLPAACCLLPGSCCLLPAAAAANERRCAEKDASAALGR